MSKSKINLTRRNFVAASAATAMATASARVLQFDCIDSIAKPQVKRLFFCQIS